MKDDQKTKAQLIEELQAMRALVMELESELASLHEAKSYEKIPADRSAKRKELRTHIEFITDSDVLDARGINISEGGISFELHEDMPFEMRFELEGKIYQHRANLVWVKRVSKEILRFGLMFTQPKSDDTF